MAISYTDIYEAILGSWDRSWELIYETGDGYVRLHGSSIDTFFENGVWISGGSLIEEYRIDPVSGNNLELIGSSKYDPALGIWDIGLDEFEAARGNHYFNLWTAAGTIYDDPDAIAWQLGPYVFPSPDDPDSVVSSSSLDEFDENNLITTWSRRQDLNDAGIAQFEPALGLDLDGDGLIGNQTLLSDIGQDRAIGDIVIADGNPVSISLATYFEFVKPPSNGTVVAFDTNITAGEDLFFVELFDVQATSTVNGDAAIPTPATAENFLSYVNADAYNNSLIHRSIPNFVIQGGGFTTPTLPADQPGSDPSPIATRPAIVNEPGNANLRGTIAMAKLGGDPNSATNQFFFNLSDANSANLDLQNGGFTVFGKVLGTGMGVIDMMSAANTYDASAYYNNGALTDLPLWNLSSDSIIKPDDFVSFEDIYVIPEVDFDSKLIEYSAASSDRTKLETRIQAGELVMTPIAGASGTVTVTVTGRSLLGGAAVSDSFSVNLDNDSQTTQSLDIDYLQALFGTLNTVPYFLRESSYDAIVVNAIDAIDSGIDLDFIRSGDNSNTVLDIYVNIGGTDSSWTVHEYDQYLELYIDIADDANDIRAEELIGEMLGYALGLPDSSTLDQAGIEALASLWGQESGDVIIRLTVNEMIEGAIELVDEVDTYALTIQEQSESHEQYITLNIGDANADLDISLRDSVGNEVAYADTTNSWEFLDLSTTEPGEYTIEVYGYGGSTGPYSLSYSSVPTGSAIEGTGAGVPWNQRDIIELGVLNGRLVQAEEELTESTFYGFSIQGNTHGGTWQISIEDAPWDSDFDLYLYRADDPFAEVIKSAADYGSDEQLSLNGLEDGDYILEVNNYTGEAADYTLGFQSPYASTGDQGDSLEANDTFETASSIQVTGELTYGGLSIHDSQDIDYFRFELEATGRTSSYVEIVLEDDSGDLDLYLYNNDGDQIDSSESTSASELISLAGVPAGVYTLAVMGYQNATGSYQLSFNLPASTSLLDDRYESGEGNDSLAQASDLGVMSGVVVVNDSLTINDQGADIDYYRFSTTDQGGELDYVELIGDDNFAADLDMSLYAANGDLIEAATRWGSTETISLDGLISGSYILEVYSYNNEESAYSLVFSAPTAAGTSLRDDAYERNNVAERATKLPPSGGRLYWDDLNLSDNNDIDWFEVDLPGDLIDGSYIRVSSLDQVDALRVTLKDKRSGDILYNDEALYASTELDLSDLLEGSYLMQVSGRQTRYSLELEFIEGSGNTAVLPDRFENNNSSDQAELVRLDNSSLSIEDLTIHQATDADWFRFLIPDRSAPSSGIGIKFNNYEGDLDLELYEVTADSTTNLIDASTGTSGEEFISFEELAAGEYAARVFAYSGISSNYTLTIDLPVPTIAPDRFEANDNIDSAYDLRSLAGVNRFNGSIHQPTDKDFFRFRTVADTTLAHSASLGGENRFSLTLYDSEQNPLRSSTGSVSLADLKADQDYFIEIASTEASAQPGNYALNFQLPSQAASNQVGGSENNESLSDWTLMIYVTASDLDTFAFADINEIEDAVSRFNIGANVAVYWDQSANGNVAPYPTGDNSQTAWSTAGKAFIEPDSNYFQVATDFVIETSEVSTGDPDTLYEFIRWAATEAPAEHYGLIMWDHGAGIYGFNFDNGDNASEDYLTTPELVEALARSQDNGVNFDLIAFDACLMAMVEIGYELKDYTDYFIASQEVENGPGYDYTTALAAFESGVESVSADRLAQSIISSFERQYVNNGNIADTLSAVQTVHFTAVAESLKSFTNAASAAPESERGVMSSLRDETISYQNIFGSGYDDNYVDLGDWLAKVSDSRSVSEEIKQLAQTALAAVETAVEFKTRDSRDSSGLAIYFPATSKSQDPVKDYGVTYESQFDSFLEATGWYTFLGTLKGLSASTSQPASSRSLSLALENTSAARPLNLGLLSGNSNRVPLSPDSSNGVRFYEFKFEGDTGTSSTIEQVGLTGSIITIRAVGNEESLASGTDTVSLSGLPAGSYIVSVDSSNSTPSNSPALVINVPEAETTAAVLNTTVAKAKDFGLIASDRLLPGGLISNGQTAYFRFETPKFPSERVYSLELLAGGSNTLEAKILSSDGTTTIAENSGAGSIEMNYRVSGQGEAYVLMVSSPVTDQGTRSLTDSSTTSFSVLVESNASDSTVNISPPSFQIMAVRQMPNGLALNLSEAPDLDVFNLYDGPDSAIDTPDLALTNAAGTAIALSAHWQPTTNELLLLAAEPLADGSYSLSIDSRSDGLVSASSGELLDGNGDGTGGDSFFTSFTHTAPEHSLSIADTARAAGQALAINGSGTHDPLTGVPLADGAGLPIHLSTAASLTSFSGSLVYDPQLVLTPRISIPPLSVLTPGSDLPSDWSLQLDSSSTEGALLYSASGTTPISGSNQEILRFHATMAAQAAPNDPTGLYGSSTLINASLTSDQLTGQAIAVDPGLIALAYSGDTTGNGTLSSLDASRIQRVVVGLDSGFDAFDDLNPILIGDTTGNGGLSSLDASRVQQQVVGLPVDSFPDLPSSLP